MMTRLDIGDLAIQACKTLVEKRDYAATIETAKKVVSELAKLDAEQATMPDEARRAIEQCEAILSDCEDIPERGEDFAAGVIEKVESIQSWIEDNRHVTEPQLTALDNMEGAVAKWLHR